MQYAQLRAFHAVALHGGFSKAAEALNLTQPAISDQVRRLEQEFAVSLFDRKPRSVELTAIGRKLLSATRRFFDAEQEAGDILSAARSLSAGSLTLYTDAPYLAMRLIAEFRRDHPGIEIKVLTGNAEHCLESVLDYHADVAITSETRQDARLTSLPLHREPLAAVLTPDHSLAAAGSIRLAELIREPLIFREPRSVTRRLFEDDLARRGITCVPALEVEGREALVEAVASGLGVGVMAASELGGDQRLVSVPISDAKSIMTEALVRLAERPPSAIIDAVFDVAERMSPAGGG